MSTLNTTFARRMAARAEKFAPMTGQTPSTLDEMMAARERAIRQNAVGDGRDKDGRLPPIDASTAKKG